MRSGKDQTSIILSVAKTFRGLTDSGSHKCFCAGRALDCVTVRKLTTESSVAGSEMGGDFCESSSSGDGSMKAANDFENIFDKFYQSTNQNFKKPIGSGLGLAICKQIIEHHKGKIWASNNVTGGACLSFTLLKNKN